MPASARSGDGLIQVFGPVQPPTALWAWRKPREDRTAQRCQRGFPNRLLVHVASVGQFAAGAVSVKSQTFPPGFETSRRKAEALRNSREELSLKCVRMPQSRGIDFQGFF